MHLRFCLLPAIVLGGFWGGTTEDDEPWDDGDFYTLLGVSPEARLSEIKRSYRRLSLEYHPDHAGGDQEKIKKFQDLARGYEVLSDDDLRRVYDREGLEGVEEYEKKKAMGEHRGHHDPFAAFFGFGGQAGRGEAKRPSIRVPLFISLKDLYLGKKMEASVFKHTRCKKCRGTGAKTKKDIHKCHKCNGQGVVVTVHHVGHGMYQQFQQPCPVCSGKGKIIKRTCNHCKGKKIVPGSEEVHIHIERGMKNGEEIVFPSMCDEVAESSEAPGDILFEIETLESESLKRDGDDLKLTIWVSLKEALLGFKKQFEHLDGHIVEFTRSGVTQYGFTEKIPGEGMPKHGQASEFGDMYVTYNVQFPESLSATQIAALQAL